MQRVREKARIENTSKTQLAIAGQTCCSTDWLEGDGLWMPFLRVARRVVGVGGYME